MGCQLPPERQLLTESYRCWSEAKGRKLPFATGSNRPEAAGGQPRCRSIASAPVEHTHFASRNNFEGREP